MGKYVLTPDTLRIAHKTDVSFIDRIKAFFKHVYYMSDVSPRTPERDHYRFTFHQFKTLEKKGKIRGIKGN